MDRIRGGAALAIALFGGMVLVAPASAGTVTQSPVTVVDIYVFTADAAVADVVGITYTATTMTLETNDPIVSMVSACTVHADPRVVTCPLASLEVDTGDNDDDVIVADSFPHFLGIKGGPGDDYLEGAASPDSIDGGAGGDTIFGRGGDDRLKPGLDGDTADGGEGSDEVDYDDGRTTGVIVDLRFGIGTVPGEIDLLSNIENVRGTPFVDDLTGSSGDNRIEGRGDEDKLHDGGGGHDTLSYVTRSNGITVDLASGANGDGDEFVGQWEAFWGTRETDVVDAGGATFGVTLMGFGGDDRLTGGNADDLLIGGSGADDLTGGPGLDVASYRDRSEPMHASLIAGDLHPDLDNYFGIEGLEGGSGADVLRGDGAVNILIGNWGADTLVGGGGADLLFGNATAGTPDGAADTVSYDDGRTTAVVSELAGGHQDSDFYSDIQNLVGGDGNDLLVGDIGPNVLIGNNGADVLVGADGIDDLRGGLPNGNADVSIDVASYRDRGVPVVATLGGANPDGDLFSDISGLEGGGAGDTLTGDAFANLILGGAGNDTLVGLAGADDLQAGEGEDSLQARDGERDSVNCGPGMDMHDEDVVDVLTDCEDVLAVVPRPPALVRCVVPNVMRRTVARAKRLLNAKRCRLGKVGRVYSRKVRKGRIVSQGRRPGAQLARNAKINVVVSRGRRR